MSDTPTDSIDPQEVICRAFPGIRKTEADDLANTGTVNQYSPGCILCREDAAEFIFYILLSGEVKVSKTINDAEVRLLKVLHPGDFFGEMALIHNAPRAATVETLSPVTVLEIRKKDFEALLQKNSSVSLAMVREVSRRLRENDQMAIEDLRVKAGELALAYQQLAEVEFARSEFLTVIAHELRTPLTAAGGFLQMIQSGRLPGDALNMAVDAVARNLADITTKVNDILFLQEMDLILSDAQPVDLGRVVAAAVEQQRTQAVQAQVGLALNIAPRLPKIAGDPKTLERAVAAVLDNAIKFSPDGGDVYVDVSAEASSVCVTVRDHGVGIPPEAMPKIFNRFFHLDEVGGHLFRGVGLGLSIAKQVIEQHGGTVSAASEPGAGTTITIRLPSNPES